MSTKTFYVYELINPLTNNIFYIGKGTKTGNSYTRLSEHIKDTRYYKAGKYRNNHRYATIAKIIDSGELPIINVLFEYDNEDRAYAKERELIALYGRIDIGTGILVNHTDGGKGGEGYKHTETHKHKMRTNNPGGKATALPVVAISPITGNIVHHFESARRAAISITGNPKRRCNINYACRSKKHTISYGYYWRYADETIEDIELLNTKRSKPRHQKTVGQYHDNKLIKTWNSASDVCRHYNNHVATLSRHLKSGNVWKGYVWRYIT